MTVSTTVMYRPTGPRELELVKAAGFLRWPPRLPGQPFFYPVTNVEYACEIAKRWNVKDGKAGFVTRFEVRDSFMSGYEVQQVGGAKHTEWWIPAAELESLNDNIVGKIEVVRQFGA